MLVWMSFKWNTYSLLVGIQTGTNHYRNQYGGSSKNKLEIELPHDAAISQFIEGGFLLPLCAPLEKVPSHAEEDSVYSAVGGQNVLRMCVRYIRPSV